MKYIKEEIMANIKTIEIAEFLGLAALAIFLPFIIHVQWLTGPIVNAILILVLFLVGIRSALILALVPSLMALSGGLLPAVLAPVVPFIMISNAILVISIDWFYSSFKNEKAGYFYGLLAGAVLKFAFLFFSVSLISKLLIKQELAAKVAQMMSWPQLATALTGGLLAWVILKWLKRI